MGLAGACLAAGQPRQIDPQTLLKVVAEAQLLHIVAGQRHHQGALLAQAEIDPGQTLELGGECRPSLLGLAIECKEAFLANMPAAAQLAPRPAWP